MWHHPLYSSAGLGWPSMEPTWQILYDAGVELVLSGHAHSYERFAPMDATGPVDPAFGVRQFVVGTGGKNLGGRVRELPESEAVQRRDASGALRLVLRPDRYEWEFLRESGERFDESGTGSATARPAAARPPRVTGNASRVTAPPRSVGVVDPHNQPTTWRIEYGTTPAYGASTLETPLPRPPAGASRSPPAHGPAPEPHLPLPRRWPPTPSAP
jgi:hypothetical protein